MSHIELDDQILNHPKFVRANDMGGSDPLFLWLGLRAYCSQFLSDGFVPDYMIADVRGPREPKKRTAALEVLKTVRLVESSTGGIVLHDYLDWAQSRDQVEEWKRKARERKASSRGKSPCSSLGASQSDISCDSQLSHSKVTVTRARGEEEDLGIDPDLQEESPERNRPSKPVLTPAERQERSFRAADPDGVALFAAWKAESGKPGAEYDWKRRELFERIASEGVTTETVVSVVRGAKLDRWARDSQKLAPASILGSAEQREKYSEFYRNPPRPVDEKPGTDRSASTSEPRLSPRDRAAAFDLGPRSRSTPLTGTDPRASPKARPGATSTDSTERNVG